MPYILKFLDSNKPINMRGEFMKIGDNYEVVSSLKNSLGRSNFL